MEEKRRKELFIKAAMESFLENFPEDDILIITKNGESFITGSSADDYGSGLMAFAHAEKMKLKLRIEQITKTN